MPLPAQRAWDPPKPADRPAVPQQAPVAELAPARPAPWLDIGTETAVPASRRGPNHFARGLVLVLALFALALGAYRFRADIAARLPAAAPALLAYGDWVDGARDALERRLGPLRSRG